MKFKSLMAALLMTLSLLPGLADAQPSLNDEFDARPLSAQEKRVVQAALTFSGDYVGLLDGAWGKGSQRALEAYTLRTAATDKPSFQDILPVLQDFERERQSVGWEIFYFDVTNSSHAHPSELLVRQESNDSLKFTAPDNSLSVVIDFANLVGTLSVHDYLMAESLPYPERYQSLKPARLITSVALPNGLSAYARSDNLDTGFVTITMVWAAEQKTRAALMAGSIQRGRGLPLVLPQGGVLAGLRQLSVAQTVPSLESTTKPQSISDAEKPNVSGKLAGTGTGFFINNTDVVTAEHVVQGCTRLALEDGSPLTLIAGDADLDLAILASTKRSGVWLELSTDVKARLGESVMALGYPYLGELGQGLTVTGGNVSALQDTRGSKERIMISAPVQPGNSGGPLVNARGAVIGVVVSRVDDLSILERTGTLPQNMNFAVSNETLTDFLKGAQVMFPAATGAGFKLEEGVPDRITQAVVAVYCYK